MLSGPGFFDKHVMKEMMEQKVLSYMRRKDYRPLNKSELARAIDVDAQDRSRLRQALKQMEQAGTILRAKKGRYVLREADDQTVMGTFRQGSREGELVVAKGQAGDRKVTVRRVLIPKGYEHTALDGDRVMVRLRRPTDSPTWLKHLPKAKQEKLKARFQSNGNGKRKEGEVIKVLERSHRPVVGRLVAKKEWVSLVPDDDARFPERIDLESPLPEGAKPGYKALVRVVSWENRKRRPKGALVKVLGPADAPGIDVLSIIHKHGLPTEFPDEVLEEADRVPDGLDASTWEKREDWREEEVITIDPFDARDFDDAIAVKALEGGGWELAVHIADVSHYVPVGSALDGEARKRGNSVYLVDRVLPMLPEKLSNGICSLRPDEERLTFCAVMRFDEKGKRVSCRFTPAVIRSQKRFTYEEAYVRMQGEGPEDRFTDVLQRAWALGSRLRKRRFREGSLDLDFPETKVILDEKGKPTEIREIAYDESHQLIEEFMLAANEAVAEHIFKAGRPSVYRIHEDPDPDKLLEYRDLVIMHGYQVGDLTHRKELQRFLRTLKGKPDAPLLKLGLLKSLKRAACSVDSLGHYGLAKEFYTHFTSPIRRYSDLVVHRVLRRLVHPESNLRTPPYKGMDEMASHLSTTERTAADAEMESKRLKVGEYFEAMRREDPPRELEVLVTEVMRMGLMVEITGYGTRGMIRVEDLPGDRYYRFQPEKRQFSAGKGHTYRVGDTLKAVVVHVDRKRGFIDLRPTGVGEVLGSLR